MYDKNFILINELNSAQKRHIQREHVKGKLHRITTGIYTVQPESEWVDLIRRNRTKLIANRFPGAVISFSSAFNDYAYNSNKVYLTSTQNRKYSYPGLEIITSRGVGRLRGDTPIDRQDLFLASTNRYLLENLIPVRKDKNKTVGIEQVENKLSLMLLRNNKDFLIDTLEECRYLSKELGLENELKILESIVFALLKNNNYKVSNQLAKSVIDSASAPYDSDRIKSFEKTIDDYYSYIKKLKTEKSFNNLDPETNWLTPINAVDIGSNAKKNFAFLESYFSNYIEGIKLPINEASKIIEDGYISSDSTKDSSDILGVYRLAHDSLVRSTPLPKTVSFIESLQARHRLMQNHRQENLPGMFKKYNNQAGNTIFVKPDLVTGTLQKAAKLSNEMPHGFARAIFMMIVITEIHPFVDGNGRIARLVMNSELSAVNQSRIIVPISAKSKYINCLNHFSKKNDAMPLFSYMRQLQIWTSSFNYICLAKTINSMSD